MLTGGGIVLYSYLRGEIGLPFLDKFVDPNPYRYPFDPLGESKLLHLEERLVDLQQQLSASSRNEYLTEAQQSDLVEQLKQRVQGVVADVIIRHIEGRYSSRIAEEAQITQLRKGIELSKARLGEEVRSLSRRNIVNLTIGIVTTGAAVTLLAYLVLGVTQQTFANFPDLLAHFIPRISVAAFIEVFSFFF